MLSLERWLSLLLLTLFIAYGYSAHFVIDANLPTFAKLSPVWPSSFPKILAVLGAGLALGQLLFWSRDAFDLDRSRLSQYRWRTVAITIGLMVVYTLCLRPLGFILSTIIFLTATTAHIERRRWLPMGLISTAMAFTIWYLIDQILSIYLRPWPFFVYGGG